MLEIYLGKTLCSGTDDAGKRNLLELAEFVSLFSSCSDGALEDKFPELINPNFDKTLAIPDVPTIRY